MKAPSWVPKRRGAVYCAPACGAGCTWEEYQRARTEGKALAATLGALWAFRVWENMHWYFEAVSPGGYIAVHGSKGSYTAYFNARFQFIAHGATGKEAVRKAVALARAALRELSSQVGAP